jgi:hypothetical protein
MNLLVIANGDMSGECVVIYVVFDFYAGGITVV